MHTYIDTDIHIHGFIHTYIHTYMHAYIHTYVRTYAHTYILNTYIHTYYGIDFGHISAQGPKEDNRASGIDFWLYFWPGVQMIENRASGIDFGNASAEECKTSGPKRGTFLREIDFGHASSCSWQGAYFRPGVQIVLTGWCVGVG